MKINGYDLRGALWVLRRGAIRVKIEQGWLQNLAGIACPACHALEVQVFEQWDRILARNARQVFERAHIQLRAAFGFEFPQCFAQTIERATVKDQIGDTNQLAAV